MFQKPWSVLYIGEVRSQRNRQNFYFYSPSTIILDETDSEYLHETSTSANRIHLIPSLF